MAVAAEIRLQIRQRARFACEYCGVNETDVGGELTIDHYHPLSKGGDDDSDNLIYCCSRCNWHKSDYWPDAGELVLWNPRRESFAYHFVVGIDGKLLPKTETGKFTMGRLNLNRPQLVTRRRRAIQIIEEEKLLKRQRELMNHFWREMSVRTDLNEEQSELLHEMLSLLGQQIYRRSGEDEE